ncbi:hypothetical protein HPP92_028913 [Vanilla planifolia]|uniref:Uncharacterized protein n=1 Tax=Vanilla planifolia TaxID=51239 RepID=A0A835P473_VANPL|nr:hypothetical protein HPP92_028913 [Vanilla planifolia]KAG0446316.1 hypothetical protein HPP92_028903 [Vanilla planifolia]
MTVRRRTTCRRPMQTALDAVTDSFQELMFCRRGCDIRQSSSVAGRCIPATVTGPHLSTSLSA